MSPSVQSYQPVVIIGAGRSGTNILRDTLCSLPGAGTWPCDEINYLWRHGNASHPDDELRPDDARPRVRRYIRRAFDHLALRGHLTYVVEKTCANSLRVEFVDRVLPEARFLFLVRDGRDVVASARKRWRAPLDLPYILKKARFVPLSDIPYYGLRYLRNRVHRLLISRDGRLESWGPRFPGMDALARSELVVLCAHQWLRCVERAEEGLATVDPGRVYRMRYEDFVARPERELTQLSRFLGIDASSERIGAAASRVTAGRVNAWREDLDEKELARVLPLISPALERYGYGAV